MKMNKRERLEATFIGQEVDRPAVALWRHWPGDDQRANDQARAHIEFQRQYDFDFIKVTPSSGFSVEDWGVSERYLGNTEGTCEHGKLAIIQPDDWLSLPLLDPQQGSLGRQLRCLELISNEVSAQVPFIQTIFNPLSVAKYLAGEETLRVHMRRYPQAVRRALEVITASYILFVQQAMRMGAAGFFAVQHAQFGVLSEEEYRIFGRPYDLRVLEATQGGWFNLLHLHGSEVMFELLSDYPVQAINWHDRETPPNLMQALSLTKRALCGGLRQWETMVRGTPQDVVVEAQDAINVTSGRQLILGTGCVTPIVAPTSNLRAARQVVEVQR